MVTLTLRWITGKYGCR